MPHVHDQESVLATHERWRRWRNVAVLLVTVVVASAWPLPAGAIVNGQADNGAHPNVGTVIWRDADGILFRSCSGTLISPTVFLTAADCVLPFPGFPDEHLVGVSFDEHIATPPAGYLPATPHADPGFAWSNGQGAGATGPHNNDPHDIAVVVLDSPASGTPAKLPTLNLLDQMNRRNGLRNTTFVSTAGTSPAARRNGPLLRCRRRRLAEPPVAATASRACCFVNIASPSQVSRGRRDR